MLCDNLYKLTIIIPVYNAENCLDNTIYSIIKQSIGFENIELILVDDNSSDNSREIILYYSKKYDNIKYFFSNKNHGFPGFGRNKGVDLASSKYVMFVDNDDELDIDMCKNMYEAIEINDCDIACCDIKEIDDISEKIIKVGPILNSGRYSLAFGDDIFNYNTGLVWNKIFKKKIIDEFRIKFLTDNYCDDQAFSIEYMLHCNNIVYLNNYAGYFWIHRNESLSNSNELINLKSLFIGYDYMVDLLIKNNKKYLINVVSDSGTLYLLIQSTLLKSKIERKKFLELLFEFEKKCDFNINVNSVFFSVVNFFVIKKKFNSALLLLSLFDKMKSFLVIRKFYRKIHINKK